MSYTLGWETEDIKWGTRGSGQHHQEESNWKGFKEQRISEESLYKDIGGSGSGKEKLL